MLDMITRPSAREAEILNLISEGLTDREIASKLYLSIHTVNAHVLHLFNKLGANNRAHLVSIGYRLGLIQEVTDGKNLE